MLSALRDNAEERGEKKTIMKTLKSGKLVQDNVSLLIRKTLIVNQR